MKKSIFFTLIFAFLGGLIFGTEARSFELSNGIPVYIKADSNSEMACVFVVINGGVLLYNPELSGIEEATLSLMQKSSAKYSASAVKKFSFETFSNFSSYSITDGSVFGMTCIEKYFDRTFDVFADMFLNPVFDKKEYDILIQDYEQSIQRTLNDPSSMLWYYIRQIVYAGHPFETKSSVTPDSIENITLSEIKKCYDSIVDSSRLSIVASGNVNEQKLLLLLEKSFGLLKKNPVVRNEVPVPQVELSGEPVVLVHESATGTGFAARVFPSVPVTSPDYAACRLTAEIYSDILYAVVREKYGACYTPYSDVASSAAPFGADYLYRMSNLTDFAGYVEEASSIMADGLVIRSADKSGEFKTEPLEGRLNGYINSYINNKYASQQTVTGVASRMAASLLQFGNIYSADSLTQKAKEVTVQDIKRIFIEYWQSKPYRWFAVTGPESETVIRFE